MVSRQCRRKISGSIFLIISGILLCIPNRIVTLRDFREDIKMILLGYMFYSVGVSYMVMKYKSYMESYSTNRKRTATKDLLKNMPIDRMQLWIYITKKKIKLCTIMTAIIIVLRITISLAAFKTIYPLDLLMTLVFNLIVPVLIA